MIGQIIFARLAADSGVGALVGDRIYPVVLPQEPTLPALTYDELSDDGSEGTGYIIRKRVRVIGWALTYASAKAVGAAVLASLRGYKNDATTPRVAGIMDETRSDTFVPDRAFHGDVIEFSCWVVEI